MHNNQHTEMIQRLQNMQRELAVISNFTKSIAIVLNRFQFQAFFIQTLKSELQFDDFAILRTSDKSTEIFVSSLEFKNKIAEKMNDNYFEKCLDSPEPLFFDLKDLPESNFRTPPYLLNAKKSGMRIAVGLGLPSVFESKNIVLLFYRNFISPEDIPERILDGIATQLSVTIHNIMINEQLEKIQIPSVSDQKETVQIYENKKGFQGIIGKSAVMQEIFEQISQVAASQSSVIIYGETGTGKELIAEAIHELSSYSQKKMIRINCAAIPSNLIESELFGHEKGSFTGATEQRKGKFEQANNGTIFLDEIGELPLELQGRLLRVLQEKEVERIGGNKRIKVNVRIVAATNRNLEEEVADGKFRSDLFYRLNVFPIHLPALRERKEDIPLLAEYFLDKLHLKTGKKITGFSQKVMNRMIENPWAGNIRELENMIERSILTAKTQTITTMDFPKVIVSENTHPEFQIKTLHEFEKEYILKIVQKCNGKIFGELGAAKLLGLPPTTLISKMQKLGIEKKHHFRAND